MHLNLCAKAAHEKRLPASQLIKVMKLTVLLITIACLQVSAKVYSQINLTKKNAPLIDVLNTIQQQSGYTFFYKAKLVENINVDANLHNATIQQALDQILPNQTLTYEVIDKTIAIKPKEKSLLAKLKEFIQSIDVTGRVLDNKGIPISGATVQTKDGKKVTSTDEQGKFLLKAVDEKTTIIITVIGYEKREVVASSNLGDIYLIIGVSKLEEVKVNAGYYSVTEEERTGSISRITSKDIEKQPVNNVLAAMQANLSGVEITQNTGVPGGGFKVQIRGQNSIQQGNAPLYIIDGVPFTSTTLAGPRALSITPDPSPLASINPSNIESIEILKDADATAIYGSRGANGVVLITTKKGKSGTASATVSVFQGVSRVAKQIDLMNTSQYMEMRLEALANEGLTPGNNDYDINGSWGSSRNTNWQKELIGRLAPSTNSQASLSGGTGQIQYFAGVGYYREGTVFPGDHSFNRVSGNFSLQFTSQNKRFNASISTNYSQTNSNLFDTDLTSFITLAPNYPSLLKNDGSLNWENNTMYVNPFAYLNKTYDSKTFNLNSGLTIKYTILPGLDLKANLGSTTINRKDFNSSPLSAYPPVYNLGAESREANYGQNQIQTWLVEPQISWDKKLGDGKFNILVGGTYQQSLTEGQNLVGQGYNSDLLLGSIAGASLISVYSTQYSMYRTNGIFGRINYDYKNKYILNATARRDGSSRFGLEKRYGNFGAIGAAWIISEENFLKSNLPFISFAKLRGSYGITGNDQIGDYNYLETWSTFYNTYQGVSTLRPDQISNPTFAWERNRKLESAIELGLLQNRINLSAGFYRNISSNQLIREQLAPSTGFNSIQTNLPATVSNIGWEFEIKSRNVSNTNLTWSTSINFTIPKNKLISYPDLKSSSDNYLYQVGQPLSILKLYNTPLDPNTGLYKIQDYDNNGVIDANDRYKIAFLGRKFYGGITNSFTYKSFQLDFTVQLVKQTGKSPSSGFSFSPGFFLVNSPLSNQLVDVLNRWQKPNDITTYQRFGTNYQIDDAYYNAVSKGSLAVSDASFVRMKNVSISYNLPAFLCQKLKINNLKLTAQGQNLFTITKYKGLDPETQSLSNLPALQVFSAGLQITF